jgi:predicted PurR-regulated permease PerM
MTATPKPPQGDLARVLLSSIGIGLLIAGCLWVVEPFLGAFLWATMIVDSTWPLMLRVQGWLGGRRGAAVAVMTVILLLALFVPLGLALSTVLGYSDRAMELFRNLPALRLPPPPAWVESLPVLGHRAATRWQDLAALPQDELAARIAPQLRTVLAWFADKVGSFGGMVVHFLLTVLISAILYAKGEGAVEQVRRFFRRLSGHRGDVIVTLAGKAIRAVALGIVVTAIIQTVIAAIGLWAASVPAVAFVAAVVFVLCIAQLGPLLALAPCVIWLYAIGAAGRGTVLLVVMLVAQAIDNVVRPVLIKRGADLSLLLILPGVIGGLLSFGIIGLFIGPVILAVTATLLQEWIATGLGEAGPAAEPEARSGGTG